MVIIRLVGGLGNQMFQYALGRSLSYRRSCNLFLDTSLLGDKRSGETVNGHALHIFNIAGEVGRLSQILLSRTSELTHHIVEPIIPRYHEEILACSISSPGYFILRGWWQSEKYFVDIAHVVQEDFTFKKCPEPVTDLEKEIVTTASVCVHVRRGDYLSPTLGGHLGFVGAEYYRAAVEFVRSRVVRPHFFVFSDDAEWCESQLSLPAPHTFVRHPLPSENYTTNDFYLMSRCRHFIIANSTFSWWAAWLGRCPDKMVIAPRRWFADPSWSSEHIPARNWICL